MKIRKLQLLMNPDSKVRIYAPEDYIPWKGDGSKIPHRYLNRKICALNPSHTSVKGQDEDDYLDVWVKSEEGSDE